MEWEEEGKTAQEEEEEDEEATCTCSLRSVGRALSESNGVRWPLAAGEPCRAPGTRGGWQPMASGSRLITPRPPLPIGYHARPNPSSRSAPTSYLLLLGRAAGCCPHKGTHDDGRTTARPAILSRRGPEATRFVTAAAAGFLTAPSRAGEALLRFLASGAGVVAWGRRRRALACELGAGRWRIGSGGIACPAVREKLTF